MLLTDAGKALLTHARQVLGQLDAVDQTLATLRGGTTTRITIGVTPWVARVARADPPFAHPAPPRCALRYPRAHRSRIQRAARWHPRHGDRRCAAVGRGGIHGTPLARLQHHGVLSARTPLVECAGAGGAGRPGLGADRRNRTPYPGVQRLWRRVLAASQPVRLHYARSAQVVGAIVRTTDMLTISPWPLIEEKARILHPLTLCEEIPEQTIALLTKHNFALSGAARDFIDCPERDRART